MFANNFLLIRPTDFSQYLQKYFLGPINKYRGGSRSKNLTFAEFETFNF